MSSVWICESGEYEQRSIDFVCASLESGVVYLKARYPHPYIVNWGEVREAKWDGHPSIWIVTGHFESVIHFSTKHICEFEFTEYEIRI